jgi:hypothetical protein
VEEILFQPFCQKKAPALTVLSKGFSSPSNSIRKDPGLSVRAGEFFLQPFYQNFPSLTTLPEESSCHNHSTRKVAAPATPVEEFRWPLIYTVYFCGVLEGWKLSQLSPCTICPLD